ncbi:hypothetical protein PoB_003001900 [Plakobranchus ocellatus]|uniref:Uncharacterized protein n=1 Tax=Plakobranchus ocellatus TaxID=259542 RepID=A0AAV4A768_9GAST|nr:hypothetical protein PoB_003001900 [Plakobranchus ocellatus]
MKEDRTSGGRRMCGLSGFVYSQSTTKRSQAFSLSVRPGRRWRGSNPRQKCPCRSQDGLAIEPPAPRGVSGVKRRERELR